MGICLQEFDDIKKFQTTILQFFSFYSPINADIMNDMWTYRELDTKDFTRHRNTIFLTPIWEFRICCNYAASSLEHTRTCKNQAENVLNYCSALMWTQPSQCQLSNILESFAHLINISSCRHVTKISKFPLRHIFQVELKIADIHTSSCLQIFVTLLVSMFKSRVENRADAGIWPLIES